jgi:hypothetical protein
VPRFSHPVPWSPIIMPSRKKNFDVLSEPFWDGLWVQAQRGLQQASEVYMFGYSLPKADDRARELILGYSNPEARITVCCGESTERICGEFAQHGFKLELVSTGPARFEDWVEAHCHDSARCAPTPIRSPSLRHLA